MDERYSVEITPFAESALREIGQYIKVNLGSTQNAISTLTAIREEIAGLDVMPARFPLTPDEPWRSEGVRRMLVRNFYVYFWVDEAAKTVRVVHVIYVGRIQKAQLDLMDME